MKAKLLKKIRKKISFEYIKKPVDGRPILLKIKKTSFNYRCTSTENALFQSLKIIYGIDKASKMYVRPSYRKLVRRERMKFK